MSSQTINLTPAVYAYLQDLSLHEPPFLQALREETQTFNAGRMQISPEQGQFMALLVKILNAKKTLDLGTFTGYSSLVVALALPQDGKVITCDVSPRWTDIAKRYWQLARQEEKIELRLGPALDTLQDLIKQNEASTFDFAFIDADKKHYLDYYENALTLLRPGGLIAIDNVLWGGHVADSAVSDNETQAIRKLNQAIFQDDRVDISMLPIGDGLTLARKR